MDAQNTYRLILGLVIANDWDIFEEVSRKHPADFPPRNMGACREIGDTLVELLASYDYTKSVAFENLVKGKSAAFAETKRKLESDPVKRRQHRDRFVNALRESPTLRATLELASVPQQAKLRTVAQAIERISSGV